MRSFTDDIYKVLENGLVWGIVAFVLGSIAVSGKFCMAASTWLLWVSFGLSIVGTFRICIYFKLKSWGLLLALAGSATILFFAATKLAHWMGTKEPLAVVPPLVWETPAPIEEGVSLTVKQLNAKSGVEGTFVYIPALGETLPSGTRTLGVTFYPKDREKYLVQTMSVAIVVKPLAKPPVEPAKKLPPITLATIGF